MPGFMPGIHVFGYVSQEDVDDRDKPGHDGVRAALPSRRLSPMTFPQRKGNWDAP